MPLIDTCVFDRMVPHSRYVLWIMIKNRFLYKDKSTIQLQAPEVFVHRY